MDVTQIVTVILSSVFSFVTAYFVARTQIAQIHEERKLRLEDEVKRYSQPILKAAADLQDRLWHLTQVEAVKSEGKVPILLLQDETEVYHPKWPMTKRDYLTSTLYYFAQYFAWIEVLREETQFMDIGKDEDTRRIHAALRDIERALSNSRLQWGLDDFAERRWVLECNLKVENANKIVSDRLIFKFQQASIGQSLLKKENASLSCMNYLEFQDKYDTSLKEQVDFDCLQDLVVRAVSQDPSDFCLARCCILANQLVDLMNLLDPNKKFVFSSERAYVKVPGYTGASR